MKRKQSCLKSKFHFDWFTRNLKWVYSGKQTRTVNNYVIILPRSHKHIERLPNIFILLCAMRKDN